MVVWVFAGGGESEVNGLIPHFLEKQFPDCQFDRKTPIYNKPAAKRKPGVSYGYGKTGKSLAVQIKERLQSALDNETPCDLILVIDDLDCRDQEKQTHLFLEAINVVTGAKNIKRLVGFAAPELEAWLIADWENTIAKHHDFRGCHQALRWWLSHEKNIGFEAPESFSDYDSERDCCQDKLSEALIESTQRHECKDIFSKGVHTPVLLGQIEVETVRNKCPIFREWYDSLAHFCHC
ncbi:MAG: DUF4276 family protein [Candidatus Parabeggiatoa sp.]|nr:DUF4276 family protein [Candidatus Parabeggiatoa sp.]